MGTEGIKSRVLSIETVEAPHTRVLIMGAEGVKNRVLSIEIVGALHYGHIRCKDSDVLYNTRILKNPHDCHNGCKDLVHPTKKTIINTK